jgi:uncharacterized protein YrrD
MGAEVYKTDRMDGTSLPTVEGQVDKPVLDWQKGQPARQLNGKAIIDIQTGEKIGQVDDLLFDPNTLGIGALLFSEGGLFNRQSQSLPAINVQVWGKDVLLVNRSGTGGALDQMPGKDEFVKLSDQLRGRYVVSTAGERVGQIDDVLIDDRGRLVGYDLSQVFIQGRLAELKRIPVEATSSLGKDVLIVNLDQLQ